MKQRSWLGTGTIESFDLRQQRLLDLVLEKVRYYYAELYETRDCYRYPLTLSRLMKLCNRSGLRTLMAVRILSHSVDVESESDPPLVYERDRSQKNAMRRPYRIYLRSDRRKCVYTTGDIVKIPKAIYFRDHPISV